MRAFKAVRPDGTDFFSGRIAYGAALASGETVRHPGPRRVSTDPATHLSVSTEAADCTGMRWPCRLLRVETVGPTLAIDGLPSARACLALRVVEELPAWQALGPNGEAVAALIERAGRLTADDARRLSAAWTAGWGAVTAREAWEAAWEAAWEGARIAAGNAAREAAGVAAWRGAWEAVRNAAGEAAGEAAAEAAWGVTWGARSAAWGAAWGTVIRDLVSVAQFTMLDGPWASVMEAGGSW